MKKIYWVGIRQSDIDDINFKFAGSITIYGDNTAGNIAYCQTTSRRINHNIANSSCNKFFQNNLEEICHTVPDVLFLFFNYFRGVCVESQARRYFQFLWRERRNPAVVVLSRW